MNNIKKYLIVLILSQNIFFLHSFLMAKNAVYKSKVVLINKVVYETENAYIVTSSGEFFLPNQSTAVCMDDSSFSKLIMLLKQAIGQKIRIFLDKDVIIGISSIKNDVKYFPNIKEKAKKVYKADAQIIHTILNWWDNDTYRISIVTRDGTFCIFNIYEVSNYYEKNLRILKQHCKINKETKADVIIYYHKIDNSDECKGEVENIEFIK
jgi:hypothetical protein